MTIESSISSRSTNIKFSELRPKSTPVRAVKVPPLKDKQGASSFNTELVEFKKTQEGSSFGTTPLVHSVYQQGLPPFIQLQRSTSQAGCQLGRKGSILSKTRPLHPSMCKFIEGSRNSIKTFKDEIFLIFFLRALYIISLLAQHNCPILIINTNNLAKHDFLKLLEKDFSGPQASTANSRWVGGTLTNWTQISKSISSFARFEKRYSRFMAENNIIYPRYTKMQSCFGGFIDHSSNTPRAPIKNPAFCYKPGSTSAQVTRVGNKKSSQLSTNPRFFSKLAKPTLIFLLNPAENKSVIEEAQKLDLPIVALTNTDTNLKGITFPIPTNNCSLQLLHFCLDWVQRVTKG